MTPPYLPAGRAGFVPLPCGFGARLLGLDPGAACTVAGDAIVAVRQERDLLRGDLTLVGADGTLLPEALGCALRPTTDGGWRVAGPAPVPPEDWAVLELGEPEDHAPLVVALDVVVALVREGPVGVLLTGPIALAEHVAGRLIRSGDADDADLVDACGMAVRDAAKAVLEAGGHVVLEERRAPDADEHALCAPLLNLLAHHRRPALAVVREGDGGPLAGDPAAIGAVACGAGVPEWGTDWVAPAEPGVLAPRIPSDASPERVQELVRGLRTARVA